MPDLLLELYIVGHAPNSVTAVANLTRLCENQLLGRYQLQIIDVLEHPEAAEAANIVATPTLVRRAPAPVRRIVGDLSHVETVLDTLESGGPLIPRLSSKDPVR
ncbi:MAG TPA: circadian clock KaiB family protein [Vicinamibacterales bacterium]|nr:circadian clock KaiB family protein [Vicinamibacterales bacterium]